ncbi:MAG: hypothetical protein JXR27_07635 [Paludibacteraceae bacterium]|nr:hypothetical protein [Paludibacteraceae bacterium]
MKWFKLITDAIRGNEDFSDIKSSTLRDVINGNIFTKKFFKKQYAFLALSALLAFFYVDNRFYSEKQLLRAIELKKKIKDVKYESLTISAHLMEISRQSNITKLINEKQLNISVTETPPVVIEKSNADNIN